MWSNPEILCQELGRQIPENPRTAQSKNNLENCIVHHSFSLSLFTGNAIHKEVVSCW